MQILLAFVLAAMTSWIPPRASQRAEYDAIAHAIVAATQDPDDAIQLAALASYESRFDTHARNRRSGARGAWQLLGRSRHDYRTGRNGTLVEQAREALRRWHLGMCLYTGETRRAPDCPLASERYARALQWLYAHPFPVEIATSRLPPMVPFVEVAMPPVAASFVSVSE